MGIRISIGYVDQEMVYTPTERPGARTISVRVTDSEGRPRSDITLMQISGDSGELYLMPLLVVGMTQALPNLISLFQRAIRFAAVNGGRFDESAFINATHAELHKPLPSPVIPQPAPVVSGGALTAAIAQLAIDAYARSHNIGSATGDAVFPMTQVVGGGYGRNYSGGDTKGICIVVCSMLNSKPAAFLVRNDFFINYAAAHYDNRALLGAPIEDEHSVSGGAEQRFQKGRMFWQQATNTVEVYDLVGKRLN